ncbi:hypothetical protein D4764_0211300 [Takifugu flavidus]|uniref:Uncharacterized protein n=1 Tax=Takifugu flavidus TaxID=433684 RepID=A0A5C6MFA7_9TELE|nr:hypothetical protein D4764_0211300 [Takifugu flavidus]
MVLTQKKVECLPWVGKEVLPQVEEFKYLGILFTSEGSMEREIDRRIGAASAVMRALNRSAMGKKELSRKAKHSIYWLIYVPILTYGHQRWVMTESQVTLKKIEEMQQQQQQLKVACIAEARKTADASGQAVTVLVGQIQLLTAVLTPVPHSLGVAEISRTKVRASKEATYPAKHVITCLTGWTCLWVTAEHKRQSPASVSCHAFSE